MANGDNDGENYIEIENDDRVDDDDIIRMIITLTMITMTMQESSNLGQWWDSDFCSPLPSVTQYGKECSNE